MARTTSTRVILGVGVFVILALLAQVAFFIINTMNAFPPEAFAG